MERHILKAVLLVICVLVFIPRFLGVFMFDIRIEVDNDATVQLITNVSQARDVDLIAPVESWSRGVVDTFRYISYYRGEYEPVFVARLGLQP